MITQIFKLKHKLNNCSKKYKNFEKTFENVLNAHAPKKTKFLRGNQKPHVDKNLHKAIMKRSELKIKANRTKQLEDITKYKKQRNLVVKLNRESKTQYFDNIQTSKHSKPFWEKCQPYFSNKHAHGDSKIILIDGINSVHFRACLLWNKLPNSVKKVNHFLNLNTR